MSLSRRDFLKLSALLAGSAALSSCAPIYQRLAGGLPVTAWTEMDAHDFLALNRLTFGPRVEERARFAEIGLQNYIEEQLAFDSIDDFACDLQLSPFKTLRMDANELEAISNELFENYDRETVPNELRQATFLRQLYSKRQLYDVMVEFWNDHFNIFVEKESCFLLKTVDDREVIRKHALGSFRDLVWASAHSPAMLVYLDNQANVKGTPNENYARELMELHTLSVDGGYTQTDVMELARCLTGWSVKKHFWLGEFTFREKEHESGAKNLLGLAIPEAGQGEAEQVIEHLAAHPSTARFIVTKLARRFLADDPPREIVEKATQVFTETGGDIKSVLRVILLDGLPLAQPKFKRPLNFVLSAARALNVETDGAAFYQPLARMGQLPFSWPTPDGYPDRSDAWMGNLMPRWQFALELTRNEMKNTRLNLMRLLDQVSTGRLEDDADALASLLLGAALPRSTRDDLLAAVVDAGASADETLRVLAAGILASPAFQWR